MAEPPSAEGPQSQEPVALDEERTVWLTALYEANARMVFNTCRRLLHNPEDAADATHEVFIRAAASLHVEPDGKNARAWLNTVARNHCLDLLRRHQRYQSALTTLGAGATQLESETVVVDRQLAQAVLEQLAVRERQALWESHVEQRSVGEIAARLGLSYLAAAQLLSRARRRAALVAAELAAILAFVRAGVLRRRKVIQNIAAHPVAAVLVIPLVATALISSGSGSPSGHAAPARVAGSVHQPARPPTSEAKPKPNGALTNANPGSGPSGTTGGITQTVTGVSPATSGIPPLVVVALPPPPPAHVLSPPFVPPHKWGHFKALHIHGHR